MLCASRQPAKLFSVTVDVDLYTREHCSAPGPDVLEDQVMRAWIGEPNIDYTWGMFPVGMIGVRLAFTDNFDTGPGIN